MMANRVKSHSWDNRQEQRKHGRYNGWTLRATWYCKNWDERDKDIRIRFEDQYGLANKSYSDDKASAELDWNAFKNRTLTTASILKLKGELT